MVLSIVLKKIDFLSNAKSRILFQLSVDTGFSPFNARHLPRAAEGQGMRAECTRDWKAARDPLVIETAFDEIANDIDRHASSR